MKLAFFVAMSVFFCTAALLAPGPITLVLATMAITISIAAL